MGIFKRTERSVVRAMCGVQLLDGRKAEKLVFMLSLCKAIYQLAMASSVHWYAHVLRREDCYVLIRALDCS